MVDALAPLARAVVVTEPPWEGRMGQAHTVAHAADRMAGTTGSFPLACGRWAPDGFDAIITPSSGRRCRRCERALAKQEQS